jgi:hypothetical protein
MISDPICSFLVVSRCVRNRAVTTPWKNVHRVIQLRMTSAVVSVARLVRAKMPIRPKMSLLPISFGVPTRLIPPRTRAQRYCLSVLSRCRAVGNVYRLYRVPPKPAVRFRAVRVPTFALLIDGVCLESSGPAKAK